MSGKKQNAISAAPASVDSGVFYKITAIIGGAFLCGALWRVRGEKGYGGKLGMCVVAAGLLLYIFSIYGERKKISFSLLPVTVILTGLTAGGWGTLIQQMSGYLASSEPFTGETAVRTAQIEPLSGLFIILCLGFGWMPLFCFIMGYYFSGKKYSGKDIIIPAIMIIALYYAFRFTLAHPITQLFCKDATQLFKEGLADKQITQTPFIYYLKNFATQAAAKKIPFGRNYFTSVDCVAGALAAAAVFIYQRYFIKDKFGSRLAVLLNIAVMSAMTLANLPFSAKDGSSLFPGAASLWPFKSTFTWSHWEFFSGFFVGLFVMIIIMLIPKKLQDKSRETKECFPHLKTKANWLYCSAISIFVVLELQIIRPFAARVFEDSSVQYVVMVVLGLVFLGLTLLATRKSMLMNNQRTPFGMSFRRFCELSALPFLLCNAFNYFVAARNPLAKMTEISSITKIMLVSFVVIPVCCWTLTVSKKSDLRH